MALQIYWSLYTGLLRSGPTTLRHVRRIRPLLDHSLEMFASWLADSSSNRRNDRKLRYANHRTLIKSLPDEALRQMITRTAASASIAPGAWPPAADRTSEPPSESSRLSLLLDAGWLLSADDRERLLTETHWRTAVRVLDSMGYLRGR
jgi:hypothetical protein